jgi:hypothetical protein
MDLIIAIKSLFKLINKLRFWRIIIIIITIIIMPLMLPSH